jgi:hypothetical protein
MQLCSYVYRNFVFSEVLGRTESGLRVEEGTSVTFVCSDWLWFKDVSDICFSPTFLLGLVLEIAGSKRPVIGFDGGGVGEEIKGPKRTFVEGTRRGESGLKEELSINKSLIIFCGESPKLAVLD